ncbi:hypothetical protein b3_0345 [Synechococcus phage B3]|nr:hypothetical protein b3_0345 [Synechococcus phage B3]QGT54949.1 hypothetical protein b23_0339 [Synechococcus phage B23]
MTFITALESELNTTETLNGAKAYKSTLNKCLDLFGKIGACRNNIKQAEKLFDLAYREDPETATRILFWVRDVRGGSGERSIFRTLFKNLVQKNQELGQKLVALVPEYGRWDDLLVLENTSVWNQVLDLITHQLNTDQIMMASGGQVSLLAKWLPSINASSKDSKRLGREIAEHMVLTERQYRKTLARLRSHIKIVEQQMCSKEWSAIDYSKVPSRASFMYRKAFGKQDPTRYQKYLTDVENGKAKINASTLYPYDVVDQYLNKGARGDKTIDLQWEALPNYMGDNLLNGLVVADVSGSMTQNNGLPLAVSISLAMYIAERNASPVWKDKFITFSSQPELQTVVGKTIGERIQNLSRADWGYNTDLISVFKTILKAAKSKDVAPVDMPQKVIIVSDMQFDQACVSNKRTSFEHIEKLYRASGYELPQLVFWNVNAIGANVPMTVADYNTCLVSGCSPSILKSVLKGEIVTAVDMMSDAVYSERYVQVGAAFN